MSTAAATPDVLPASRTARRVRTGVGLAVLVILTLLYVAPLIWMGVTSVKTQVESTTWPLTLLPAEASTTDSYDLVTGSDTFTPVLRWFMNSLVAATLHALLVLATAAPAAYALARMNFPGKRVVVALIIGTLFIPPVIFLLPNFMIVDAFGWLNRLPAVIVPLAASAFGVFLLRQFFLGLPEEIEEAARIDGANTWQIFWNVVLPLSRPALATLVVLSFLTNWNDFLWPVYTLFTPEALTLPAGLARLQGAYTTNYPAIMAGGVIASAPVIALFVFAQRYVIEGVSRSGLKG